MKHFAVTRVGRSELTTAVSVIKSGFMVLLTQTFHVVNSHNWPLSTIGQQFDQLSLLVYLKASLVSGVTSVFVPRIDTENISCQAALDWRICHYFKSVALL